ncbi:MAG TPA: hypothetical protein DCE23_08385 [Firmicutes bacterium]|nr:hypothetical protein [Bacillota bacterium]
MFNTKIPLYGLAIICALISNVIVVIILYKKYHFNRDEMIGALVYENIGIIFGAKLLTYLQDISHYGKFDIYTLGLSSFGGVIGAIICLILFGLQFKKSLKEMMFLFMPSIPLMYSIGKVGCFLVGCCYGIEYNGIGNVVYNYSFSAPVGVHLFPVQIIETVVFLCIFVYMFIKQKYCKFNWNTLGISFCMCGLGKFILDYFRNGHAVIIVSLNQIISLIFVIIGLFLIYKKENNIKE